MKLTNVSKELVINIKMIDLIAYYDVLARVVDNMSDNDDKTILTNLCNEIQKIFDDVRGW